MSFNSYKSIANVLEEFPLIYEEKSIIKYIPYQINFYFQERLELVIREGVVFNSEYAICENIISPILTEIWQNYREKCLVWSHQPLNYDDKLSGIPDYIIAGRSPRGKVILEQPYLIVVEAKKDNFEEGWGQCLAELIAVQKINNNQEQKLFGIVSNGKLWEFAQLQNKIFTKNIQAYLLDNLGELMSAINFVFSEAILGESC
jgi:hypothetical protein